MAESAQERAADGRRNGIHSRYLTDTDEISRIFKVLRDHRAELQLRFDQDSTTYQAKVLDLQGSSMLIEDIQPRGGMRLLRAGQSFTLSARVDGMYLHSAHNRVHKSDSERSVPFFHVALPTNLLHQQRRRSTRFQLPLRVAANGAQVTLYPSEPDSAPLVGTIIDISAGGCRAEFSGFKLRPIKDEDPLEGCALHVPNLLELNAKAAIRHSTFDAKRQALACGIEFTEMHVTDRRRLEQFIQTIAKISPRA